MHSACMLLPSDSIRIGACFVEQDIGIGRQLATGARFVEPDIGIRQQLAMHETQHMPVVNSLLHKSAPCQQQCNKSRCMS